MAFLQCNLFSPALCFPTDVNIFIPTPDSDEVLNHKDSSYFKPGTRFPVVYLLHGAYGDYSDWQRLTSIEKYAQARKVAVVMPSAGNSFYQDMAYGSAYLTYLTQELPRFVKANFPVSAKRQDTFTAGLSMGGYGAVHLALTCPEQYAAAASLSGAVDLLAVYEGCKSGTLPSPFRWADIFGDDTYEAVRKADPATLIKALQQAGKQVPGLFMSCGVEDFIYPINLSAREKLTALGASFTWEEHPGLHDWDYWDTHIQRALDWLLAYKPA